MVSPVPILHWNPWVTTSLTLHVPLHTWPQLCLIDAPKFSLYEKYLALKNNLLISKSGLFINFYVYFPTMVISKALKLIPQNLKVAFLLPPIMDENPKYFQVPKTCGTPGVSNISLWSSVCLCLFTFFSHML